MTTQIISNPLGKYHIKKGEKQPKSDLRLSAAHSIISNLGVIPLQSSRIRHFPTDFDGLDGKGQGRDMDNRPIGVFDSGLGGLTAVRSLRQILPEENLIYFGDTARVPYGGRSKETLLKYARQDVRFLRSYDLKAIVIACGTVSTTSLTELQAENDLPIIGVVEPTCRRAVAQTRNKKVGLIATLASVRSGAYEAQIKKLDGAVQMSVKSCPLFVPLVENGRIHPGDTVIETVAREYLEPLRDDGIDTLILGCTHYPLIAPIIAGIMGPGVTLVSAGEESAFELKRMLKASGLRADENRRGDAEFCVSDRVEDFERIASLFLQEDLRHTARRVDIEQY